MRKEWIPNLFTALNIAMGTLSLMFTVQGNFNAAGWAILLAAVADGLDGRVARAFGVAGDFGKELDSLCDVVSFGVAPAVLLYTWQMATMPFGLGAIAAVLLAVCGAMRLARFNINTDVVHGFFMGMPIPTTGCLAATYVLSDAPLPVYLTWVLTLVLAWVMVSEMHYPDFKGKAADPVQKKALAAVVVIGLLLLFDEPSRWAFVFFFMYFLFGILNTIWNRLDRSGGRRA